jgi:hypothetical protein
MIKKMLKQAVYGLDMSLALGDHDLANKPMLLRIIVLKYN